MNERKMITAEKLTDKQVSHMMPVTDVKTGDLLLFMANSQQQLMAIDILNPRAVIGQVLSAPVKTGIGGYYTFQTDLHKNGYIHHPNEFVAIVRDLLTKEQRKSAKNLVYTSADDCRVSLNFATDTDVLSEALKLAQEEGFKTKANHIQRKINQLLKTK